MSKDTKSDAAKVSQTQTTTTTSSTQDLGQKELQGTFDKANEQGFFGVEVDTTDNFNYTVRGVGKGLPTPETDAAQAQKVRTETGSNITNIERNQAQQTTNDAE